MRQVFAYCHGFLSSEQSKKGQFLRDVLSRRYGVNLHLLNLNANPEDLSSISFESGFRALDSLWKSNAETKKPFQLVLIGSSLGGQIAASYAALHPDRVKRLVLLCPAVNTRDVISHWVESKFPNGVQLWREKGFLRFPHPHFQEPVPVPVSFLDQCDTLPPYPIYKCPTLIFHGRLDDVVHVDEVSIFLKKCPEQAALTTLIMVEDDHELTRHETLWSMEAEMREFLQLDASNGSDGSAGSA